MPGLVKPFSPLENNLEFLVSTKAMWPPPIIIIPENMCILSEFLLRVLWLYFIKCTNGTVPFGMDVLTAKQVLRVKCRDRLEEMKL